MTNKKNAYRIGKTYEELYGLDKSLEYKKKLSLAIKGRKMKPLSLEHKKKISSTMKKIMNTPEMKKKTSETTKRALSRPETREKISAWQRGRIVPKEVVEKRVETIKRNGGFKQSDYQKMKASIAVKEARKYQIFPKNDTKIEVKIQNFLKELNIEFFTHQYIKIEHGYQCDILIPSKNLIIECDGDYWHGHWNCGINASEEQKAQRIEDLIRTNELRSKGYIVLRFWESEIKPMEIQDLKNKLTQMEII
jgi:very-short-patch-repair endonuclease